MATTDSPYCVHPPYADVEYIDGKLKVAEGIVRRTNNSEIANAWSAVIDKLLEQRSMLSELEHGDYR